MSRYQVPVYLARSTFEMSDGRTLACEYRYWHTVDDGDSSDPVFTIDGEEIAEADFPKGLEVIGHRLLNDPHAKVTRVELEPAWGDD